MDDLLAGGASLEELAKEEGMTFATTDYAPGADDNDPIAAYKASAMPWPSSARAIFPKR